MKYAPDVLLRRWCGLALCINEAEYIREMRRLKIATPSPFVLDGKTATMHWFDNRKAGDDIAIVCIDQHALHKCSGTAIAAVLVHEAVHVFQHVCERMGEEQPSKEFEAYSIQRISQDLMYLYGQMIRRQSSRARTRASKGSSNGDRE